MAERKCGKCGRMLLPRHGYDLEDGVLCELCSTGRSEGVTTVAFRVAEPTAAEAWTPPPPDPMDVIHGLERQLEKAVRAAADVAMEAGEQGAWKLKVDVAEEEALRCIRLLRHAGDAWGEGDPVEDGFRILARAMRAAADTLDATADAVKYIPKR